MFFLLGIVILSVSSEVSASKKGHMKLLSVAETDNGFEGRMADLYLEIEPGQGRVFIDTFPLTRLDTQISTRFAKEITCSFINKNCNHVDMFYTIRSEGPLVGGPSAGAAIAVLTASVLDNLDMDEKTVITGTINSGGLIGPVGGLKEKIEAAQKNGMKKVLIPPQNGVLGNDSLITLGENLGIDVIEVSTLNQAIYEFTGEIYEKANDGVKENDIYIKTMSKITDGICNNTFKFYDEMPKNGSKELLAAKNLTLSAKTALSDGKFYSAASYCFGANIKYYYSSLLEKNLSEDEINLTLDKISSKMYRFHGKLDKWDIRTLNDLQAYMITRERLISTQKHITLSRDFLRVNRTKDALYQLAYANERYESAELWSSFYGTGGKKYDISNKVLKQSCIKKIGEAQERIEYLKFLMPYPMDSIEKDLSLAFNDLKSKDYALCLFKASKTKSEIDALIYSFGLTKESVDYAIENKLSVIRQRISEQQDDNSFPLLGYSYYEYASSLKNEDPSSALLYAGYALEMSDLDMYLGNKGRLYFVFDYKVLYYFILGALFGGFFAIRLFGKKLKKSMKKT